MQLRVCVLGPLRVERGDAPVDVGGRRARAVLARLAIADGYVVAADALIEDLWPDETPRRALGALQVQISHLRRALEPERPPRAPASVLVSAAPGYALRLPADALDSRRATTLIDAAAGFAPAQAESAFDEALLLWSGMAFAEFADEPWAAAEVARLGELRVIAREGRARARLLRGGAHRAVSDLERLVAEYPLRESGVGLLVAALYLSQRQADALAVLARVRRQLVDELGVDPNPAVRELEHAVLTHANPATVLSVVSPLSPASSALPKERGEIPAPEEDLSLIGRVDELARLHAAADHVRARPATPGRMVLVSADAGGGKTALVDAFRAAAAAGGWVTASGRCPEVHGAPPGWAWREVVGDLSAARVVGDDLADRLAPLSAPAGPAETFWVAHAVTELVVGLARPTLVVLDDLHRAEEETLQLLRIVVSGCTRAAAPVLVVATLRPAESGPGLEAALAALTGEVAGRIVLPGLGNDEVVALLARFGVRNLASGDAANLRERTAGNPLFVREMARMIMAGREPDAVPDGVRDLLRAHLSRLPAESATLLRHAAVLGRDVDVDVLLASVPDADAALEALELGVLTGLLIEPNTDRVRFTHALVQETLYADIPQLRRARLHAAVLDALQRLGRAGDAAVTAHHALSAGSAVPAARALPAIVAAAREATRYGAYREAARLWAVAVDLAPDAGSGRDREIDLRCARVSALAHAGDTVTAMAARDEVIARAAGTDRLADALTSYDAPTSWTIRDAGRVSTQRLQMLEQELARASDPALRTRLLVALVLETESGDVARARSASEEALVVSEGLDPVLRCAALNARGFVVNGPDLHVELEQVGRELLAVAEPAGLAGYRSVGHHLLFMVACGRLDFDEAQRQASAAVAVAPGGQLGFTIGWSAIFTAMRALITGDAERAELEYAAVQHRIVAVGGANAELMGLFGLIVVRHAQGRLGELADLVSPLAGHERMTDVVAAVWVAAGRLDEAQAVWRADLEPVRSYYWQLITALRAEVAIAVGAVDVAAGIYADLQPWAGTLAGASSGSATLGPVDLTLLDLGAFLGRPPAEREKHRQGALALARRVGAVYWQRRALAA